jgi:hypothetical protein
MALALYDRVQQTGTANTTVSFTLSAGVTGFQAFTAIGNGNTTYYAATDATGNWEVGLGTYSTSGPTLTRTTVYSSSNTGSAVTFSGTVNVFVTYPASRSVNLDANSNATIAGLLTSTFAPNIGTVASASTVTPTTAYGQYNVTALAVSALIATPTGTPADGQKLIIRIEDNGTARSLTWTTSSGGYRIVGTTLPSTTVAGKTLYVGCIYNAQDVFWDVVAISQQA